MMTLKGRVFSNRAGILVLTSGVTVEASSEVASLFDPILFVGEHFGRF